MWKLESKEKDKEEVIARELRSRVSVVQIYLFILLWLMHMGLM